MVRTKVTARRATGGIRRSTKFSDAELRDGSTFKIAARLGFNKFLSSDINDKYSKYMIFVPTDEVMFGFLDFLGISLEDFEASSGLQGFIKNLIVREHDGFGFTFGDVLNVENEESPSLNVVDYNDTEYRFALHYTDDDVLVPVYIERPIASKPFIYALRGIYSTPELNESYKR